MSAILESLRRFSQQRQTLNTRLEGRCEPERDWFGEAADEIEKWKRLYENTIVQKEGMELYDEINRLNNRVKHLEDVITKGVWPK